MKIIMRLQKDIGPIVCTVYHQCAIVLEMAKILVCSPCSPPSIFSFISISKLHSHQLWLKKPFSFPTTIK